MQEEDKINGQGKRNCFHRNCRGHKEKKIKQIDIWYRKTNRHTIQKFSK